MRSLVLRIITSTWALAVTVPVVLGVVLPIGRLLFNTRDPNAWPPGAELGHACVLSIILNVICFGMELMIAFGVGEALAKARVGTWVMLICAAPLFFGPTVCSLLWKLLVSPSGGFTTRVLGMLGLHLWDWTRSAIGPPLIFSVVQMWTWGPAAGAALAALAGRDGRIAESLFLLDGGRPAHAFFWSLKATRAEWLLLLMVALAVENFRAFETIHVFGTAGRATDTLGYLVFKSGYLESNPAYEGIFGLALIGLNIVGCSGLIYVLRKRGIRFAP